MSSQAFWNSTYGQDTVVAFSGIAVLADGVRHHSAALRGRGRYCALAPVLVLLAGCNSIMNSWLDPTTLGAFDRTATLEIRTSLTLEDTPPGIPGAVCPLPEDLVVCPEEYPISAGDTLAVEIYELRQRLVPYQAQAVVSTMGYVNLPVVGRISTAGLTVKGFEGVLVDELRRRGILKSP